MMKDWGGKGWGSGLLGVLIFSGSLPATRVAVAGFSPLFLTGARAAIAALLGAACRGHDILYSTAILKKTGLRLKD